MRARALLIHARSTDLHAERSALRKFMLNSAVLLRIPTVNLRGGEVTFVGSSNVVCPHYRYRSAGPYLLKV
eukprot:COSAG05_NODE_8432_length_704_cov_1.953719_1_plen_70_part_10